jgi:hypothetical protein
VGLLAALLLKPQVLRQKHKRENGNASNLVGPGAEKALQLPGTIVGAWVIVKEGTFDIAANMLLYCGVMPSPFGTRCPITIRKSE